MINTQTVHINLLYDRFKQENVKLQIQVQDLTRELCSTVSARLSLTWTAATTVPSVPIAPDLRVSGAAAR